MTAEVKRGDASRGEYINSLTGEGLGDAIGFIVCYYQQGRFAATKDGKSYVAFQNEIPEAWEPLVGSEWVGQPFTEYPEAEEKFRHAVNVEKTRKWENGPLVSTTHNFTGYAIIQDDETGEDILVPGRLSLKRTDVPAAKKLIQLKRMLRLRTFWDQVFDLTTAVKQSGNHESFIVQVKAGRPTTDEEKLLAVQLAQDVASQRVQDNSASDAAADAPVEPDAPDGALAV